MLAGDKADSARIRAAIPFALLRTAGNLSCLFELIPDRADI
jgi:hypothetical protein